MSSNIKVQRICQYCSKEFVARTTVTKCCSNKCSKAAYKARKRAEKVKVSNIETTQIRQQPVEVLKAKEFLTVREVAQLLNCSVRSVYYYIESGTIRAFNLGERLTRVKRTEIDKLFNEPVIASTNNEPERFHFEVEDGYTINEVMEKYGISNKALYDIIKRENIPKIKKGWYTYVPKQLIDDLLT
jgi:excisionase family DNA binding protein